MISDLLEIADEIGMIADELRRLKAIEEAFAELDVLITPNPEMSFHLVYKKEYEQLKRLIREE